MLRSERRPFYDATIALGVVVETYVQSWIKCLSLNSSRRLGQHIARIPGIADQRQHRQLI
jgi:hypothetical protein